MRRLLLLSPHHHTCQVRLDLAQLLQATYAATERVWFDALTVFPRLVEPKAMGNLEWIAQHLSKACALSPSSSLLSQTPGLFQHAHSVPDSHLSIAYAGPIQ